MSTVHEEKKPAPNNAGATPQSKRTPKTFDGKIISIKGDTLVMRSKEGRDYSHTLAENAKVCCDGTACESSQLKVGNRIRVTTQDDDHDIVTSVESLDEESEFAKRT